MKQNKKFLYEDNKQRTKNCQQRKTGKNKQKMERGFIKTVEMNKTY